MPRSYLYSEAAKSRTMIPENIYGHAKRLHWLLSHLTKDDTIVELGCGTGYMVCLPLAQQGYDIVGVDLDAQSIGYGRELFRREGLNCHRLQAVDIVELDRIFDVVIASEVLEHIPNTDLGNTLQAICKNLKEGGQLLVTVPNGYGWFEFESYLWFKIRLGRFIERTYIARVILGLKHLLLGNGIELPHPSTLAESPHVQRFTHKSIQRLLRKHGLEVTGITGSVLFAGPFTNLLFTGFKAVMQLNCLLGRLFPPISVAFYVSCRLPSRERSFSEASCGTNQ
jgi:2-polyprenyl-3-methyl-5-hydroxy-6-metoxy-1,4-benzoquinol methylase